MKDRLWFWNKLSDYANDFEFESIALSYGFGQVRFKKQSRPTLTDAFEKLRVLIDSIGDRSNDVFVVSAHNLDEVTSVDKIEPDHECEAQAELLQLPGGSGANTAFLLALLGSHVAAAGAVGEDATGQLLRSELARVGVEVSGITSVKAPTGRTIIIVDRSAKRFILVIPGANSQFAANASEASLVDKAINSKILHLSSFAGQEEFRLQLSLIKAVSGRVLISLTPGAIYSRQGLDRLADLMRAVHVMFLYREQLLEIVKNSSAEIRKPEEADTKELLTALFLWRRKNHFTSQQIVVVKEALSTTNERSLTVGVGTDALERYICPQRLPGKPDFRTKDTTGAGDSVAAGFLYGLLNGADLDQCVDLAFLLAAFASTKLGARSAFEMIAL